MDKNRLVLTLLLKDSILINSREFVQNNVSDISTVLTYLNFNMIDEIFILNVSDDRKNKEQFFEDVKKLTKQCFIPVSIGGGISSLEDCYKALDAGADKIVINTKCANDKKFITQVSDIFGKQFVVVSVDVKKTAEIYEVFVNRAKEKIEEDFISYIQDLERHGAGEILLRSINNDGSGDGYDLELIKLVSKNVRIPLVAAGGMGDFNHLSEAINSGANAVNVGNLFHFIGEGLIKAKDYLKSNGMNFPRSQWSFSITKKGVDK